MKKVIIVGASLFIIVLIVFGVWVFFFGIKRSPAKSASFKSNGLEIAVSYGQPSKRGRLIFGDEKDAALVPFHKYWRLGANDATEITLNKNVSFAGKAVNAGTYRMYAVPGPETWQVSLNSGLGKWGATEPEYELDVIKVDVPAQTAPEIEQFTIKFDSDSVGVQMDIVWDKTLVRVPIVAQ